uniref:Glutathione S-transferase omega 2 n=1 Tax=Mus musculus TaxID=10090 RepID=A0A494BBG0_MOUSE
MSGDLSRCLGKGSCPPGPVPEGVIRIYSMRFCPYSHRARLVLKAKGIRFLNIRTLPSSAETVYP